MKSTAVLLFPHLCMYEIAVALSVLSQAKKPTVYFSASDEVILSEEGIPMKASHGLEEEIDPRQFDSLLISGSMNPFESYLNDDRYLRFVKQFDRPEMVIGAISSGPILLSMNGMLAGKDFTCGVPDELFADLQLDPEKHRKEVPFVAAENILTAVGWHYVDFGIQFGTMLGLDFNPKWYK